MGGLPLPKVPLTDICSVVFNNTLYTYSADAFQALPLTAGAKWKELPGGEKVTGGVCVGSTPGDPSAAALFIVGGKGAREGYHGLQKFTYSKGVWETITLPEPVTQDRLWHGATYINSTDSILVYAGNQDGNKNPSSQTFTVGASAPHTVLAFESIAPPTINPMLLPWSANEAVLIGGNDWNKNIMLFSAENKWVDSGASLAAPVPKDTKAVKTIVLTGDDGSKNLYSFDMSVSPNTVTRTVLFTGPKQPVQNSAPVKRSVEEEDHASWARKRQATPLTVNAWPAYNSTLAPGATRDTFALAEDPNGLVVVAGGNQDDVLCMFNARENSWKNATAALGETRLFASESIAKSSSVSSSTPTSTSAPSTTTDAAAATATTAGAAAVGKTDGATTTNTILAVVLSSIFGIAIVLFGIYWCLQRKRRQNAHMEAGHMRRASGTSSNEKSGIGYATNSLPHGPPGAGVFRGHQTQDSQSSFSSMAILMGRLNQQKPGQSAPPIRNTSQNSKRASVDSTFRAFKSTISKPIPQASLAVPTARPASPTPPPMQQMRDEKGVSFAPGTVEPRPRSPSTATAGIDREGDTRRSSGWNRYWSGGSALGLLGFGSGNGNGNAPPSANSKRTTMASESSSRYSNTQHRITQDSATVPPLQIYEPRASFSVVASRSPTIAQHNEKLKEAMLGKIETQRPVSAISSVSGYSSGIPASVHEAWDPTNSKPWGYNQPQNGTFYNSGPYATPLAPASAKPSPQQRLPQNQRDDMSWLNLGDNR
ncbi:hypothetical protein B0T16DRAFT_317103 [Cercophora newfieldiana]|uniref:Pre-mRNA splicing factor CLF1 n=1 Tax=Cercophora newfieldiana TaxID=92897 RepID=A0AA40D126_9PEZI|nr:hypothetical protein B0T16DRAFT_317103 [Cercophora newfieldiana]